jgi:hypothetical protein
MPPSTTQEVPATVVLVGSGVERGTGVGLGATALEASLPPVLGAAVGAGAAGGCRIITAGHRKQDQEGNKK